MKLAITLVSVLAVTSVAGVAHADKKDKADQLFRQGKKLMTEKRYADACEAFEESYKLDPGIGAQLNIAKCYEEWGKLGRAFLAYQLSEKLAKEANDPRVDKIHELVANLDAQVPRLTVKPPKDAPKDLVVSLDAKPITALGEPIVVDPGPHTLEWGVGSHKKQKVVPMDRGAENEVSLEVTKAMREASKPEADRAVGTGADDGEGDKSGGKANKQAPDGKKPATPGRSMRIGGIALGGAGVLAIGVSSVMTLSARSKYNDALDTHCMGMKNMCSPEGLDITHDARSTANVATVVFAVGAAMVGGGVALYLLAPSKGTAAPTEEAPEGGEEQTSRYLVPSVTPSGAGLVYGGTF